MRACTRQLDTQASLYSRDVILKSAESETESESAK